MLPQVLINQFQQFLLSIRIGLIFALQLHVSLDQLFVVLMLNNSALDTWDPQPGMILLEVVVVSVLPLGRFLASIFSTLSCFLPFSLVPHKTILSETRTAYLIVSFPLVFFLSSDPLSPPSEGFRPIQFFFLLQITSIRLISSCTICSTSSFVFMSLQLIFSIFLHTNISKASGLRISSFLYVHVSACIESYTPYYSFDDSLFYVFIQIFAQQLLPLVEGILSHTNPCLDFCLASAIACDEGSKVPESFYLF